MTPRREFLVSTFIICGCLLYVLFYFGDISGRWNQKTSAALLKHGVHVPSGSSKAYVFYVTSEAYLCYALVNVYRLTTYFNVSSDIDIVIVIKKELYKIKDLKEKYCTSCIHDRVRWVPHKRVRARTAGNYYKDVFMKLTVFELYEQYSRIVYLDADGLILANLDHLFDLNMQNRTIAMPLCHNLKENWLCSTMFVADLSKHLFLQIANLTTPDALKKLNRWIRKNHLYLITTNADANDMEVMNYLFKRGDLAHILPEQYLRWDFYFLSTNSKAEFDIMETMYVHFDFKNKPHQNPSSRYWSNETAVPKYPRKARVSPVFKRIYNSFWRDAALMCPRKFW